MRRYDSKMWVHVTKKEGNRQYETPNNMVCKGTFTKIFENRKEGPSQMRKEIRAKIRT